MQQIMLNVLEAVVVKRRGYTDRLYITFDAKHPLAAYQGMNPSLEIDCMCGGGEKYARQVLGLTDVRVIDAG